MPAKMREDRIFKTRIQSYSPDLNGRWSLLKISPQKTSGIEAWCQLLLKRYGIVFREMISRVKLPLVGLNYWLNFVD